MFPPHNPAQSAGKPSKQLPAQSSFDSGYVQTSDAPSLQAVASSQVTPPANVPVTNTLSNLIYSEPAPLFTPICRTSVEPFKALSVENCVTGGTLSEKSSIAVSTSIRAAPSKL